jgi:hypothetical protein
MVSQKFCVGIYPLYQYLTDISHCRLLFGLFLLYTYTDWVPLEFVDSAALLYEAKTAVEGDNNILTTEGAVDNILYMKAQVEAL